MTNVTSREALRAQIISDLTRVGGPFELSEIDSGGYRVRAYRNTPATLREIFAAASGWADRPAVTYEGSTQTWAQVTDDATRCARALVERFGIAPGDRVALAMRNLPEWFTAFMAITSLGAVCVPLNSWWSGPELEFALADCGARVLFADPERVVAIEPSRERLTDLKAIVEIRPRTKLHGDYEWRALLNSVDSGFDFARYPLTSDDDCTILYTSGTTGRPKGAVATHRAHVSNLHNILFQFAADSRLAEQSGAPRPAPPARPTTMVPGPLFHVSNIPKLYLAAVRGIHLVFMYKWDAGKAIDLIEELEIDSFSGVPTMVRQLLDTAEQRGAELRSLRNIGMGGAPTPSAQIERIRTQFDGRVGATTGYGMTEATGAIVGIGAEDFFERPLSVGRVYPSCDIRIVDPHDVDVADGELGEALLRGPVLARGYWQRDDPAFTSDGWLRSGDVVRRDTDGFLYLVDRLKDIVIRGGENVYSSEVEDVLARIRDVEEVAVLGLPHDLLGEEVTCVLRVPPGSTLTADEVITHAAAELAPFKIPSRIAIWTEPLPRNPTGKVLKRELRDRLTALSDAGRSIRLESA